MNHVRWGLALLITGALAPGCSVIVDGAIEDRDAGSVDIDASEGDSGPPANSCTGMADGIRCMPDGIVEPFVCIGEICVLATCGDGVVDAREGSMHAPEQCDDGNGTPADGCEPDCTFSCSENADCDDLESCSGSETCNTTTHACESGTAEADGTACTIAGSKETAACRGGICRAGACPDGVLDAGEECDPAAPAPDDGCEEDCTFSCETDFDCADGDACNGNETCDVAMHVCVAATATLDCDDEDPCTTDSCVSATGCANVSILADTDMDGHFAITASCGGDDCDDGNPARYAGAPEACGATADFNCDGSVGVTPTHYRDCDGDGYAATATGSVVNCTEPAPATGCPGGWTTRAPLAGAIDCLDTSVGASVNPGQSAYYGTSVTGLAPAHDYNCSGAATREFAYGQPPRGASAACSIRCDGDTWYNTTSAPTCGGQTTLSRCQLDSLRFCRRTLIDRHTVRCH